MKYLTAFILIISINYPKITYSQSVTAEDLTGTWYLSSTVSFIFGDVPYKNDLLIIRNGQQIHATHSNVLETNLDQEMLWIKLKSKKDSTKLIYVNIRKVNAGTIKAQVVDLNKPNPGWVVENDSNTLIFLKEITMLDQKPGIIRKQ
jgi:hypothetical protein